MDGCLAVCSLQGKPAPTAGELEHLFEECLFYLYRILFLLFAEARFLLPMDNSLYRDNYSLEHLRAYAEETDVDGASPYMWHSLSVLFGLIAGGVESSALRLPCYNGKLFSPGQTPFLSSTVLPDRYLKPALRHLSLSGRPRAKGRPRRYCYQNLGIVQLGSIFEGLLPLRPFVVPASSLDETPRCGLMRRLGLRKSTGSFYTPNAISAHLVKEALSPLVEGRSSEEILEISVLDPAMGSGAFLIQVLRFLARAYGEQRSRESGEPAAAGPAAMAENKRRIAENCIFGVDRMPLAVELAKVSIWLETAEAGKPLNFLDHRLRPGDSLVGASFSRDTDGFASFDEVPDEALRAWNLPPGMPRGELIRLNRRQRKDMRTGQAQLFGASHHGALLDALREMRKGLLIPDESPGRVREKESLFDALRSRGSRFSRWKEVLDAWCGLWFPPISVKGPAPPTTFAFRDFATEVLEGRKRKEKGSQGTTADMLQSLADGRQFFHWELEFPEVFSGGRKGFDAIVGNPPWEVLKPNRVEFFRPSTVVGKGAGVTLGMTESAAEEEAWQEHENTMRNFSRWFRFSGNYPCRGSGDLNTYKLFLERCFNLLAEGGNLGFVLPSGFAADQGSSALRRLLFQHSRLRRISHFRNKSGIFPIHRSFEFLLLETTKGGVTEEVSVLGGLEDVSALKSQEPVKIQLSRLKRFSPESLSLMCFTSVSEYDLMDRIYGSHPLAGDDGAAWHIRFKNEIHVSNDRDLLHTWPKGADPAHEKSLRPLCEGKSIWQFRPWVRPPRWGVDQELARKRVGTAVGFKIVYRRIARGSDERSLVACLLPGWVPCEVNASVVHVQGEAGPRTELFVLSLLNSLVLEYVTKRKAAATLNFFLLRQVPMPRLALKDPLIGVIAALAARLVCTGREHRDLWKQVFDRAWRRMGVDEGGWSRAGGWSGLEAKWGPEMGFCGNDEFNRDQGERFQARCELDAAVALAFGLDRAGFAAVLEDCQALERAEIRRYGSFITRKGCMEAYERMARFF
jgi:hypothetical protein